MHNHNIKLQLSESITVAHSLYVNLRITDAHSKQLHSTLQLYFIYYVYRKCALYLMSFVNRALLCMSICVFSLIRCSICFWSGSCEKRKFVNAPPTNFKIKRNFHFAGLITVYNLQNICQPISFLRKQFIPWFECCYWPLSNTMGQSVRGGLEIKRINAVNHVWRFSEFTIFGLQPCLIANKTRLTFLKRQTALS